MNDKYAVETLPLPPFLDFVLFMAYFYWGHCRRLFQGNILERRVGLMSEADAVEWVHKIGEVSGQKESQQE